MAPILRMPRASGAKSSLRSSKLAAADRDWSVYVVRCGDGSLYTGIAKDVAARLSSHNAGRGAAYTRTRGPVLLLYAESGMTRSEALVREAGIKALPRKKKEMLVAHNGAASGPAA